MAEIVHPRGDKTTADSQNEWIRNISYEDINGEGPLFGGRLMEWIDEVAGVCAIRHCQSYVTTAAVDNLVFKHGAVLNDILVIVAKVTYVGNTSLEVRVDTYVEDVKSGLRSPINRAYVTEVSIDDEGHPQTVPFGLTLSGPGEEAEWEAAKKRIALRKQRRLEGF